MMPLPQRQFDESAEAKRQAKVAAEKRHSDQGIRLEQLKAVLASALATQVRSDACVLRHARVLIHTLAGPPFC
jgi:hypothetical protein